MCVAVCPGSALQLAEGRVNGYGYRPVTFWDPEEICTGCGLCAVMCPHLVLLTYRWRSQAMVA